MPCIVKPIGGRKSRGPATDWAGTRPTELPTGYGAWSRRALGHGGCWSRSRMGRGQGSRNDRLTWLSQVRLSTVCPTLPYLNESLQPVEGGRGRI